MYKIAEKQFLKQFIFNRQLKKLIAKVFDIDG